MRRKFLKIITASLGTLIIFPHKFIYAETKKIINQNLTEEQKEILFNEGTERPFTSALIHEKRKGFYHCANCGNKLFSSESKFDSGTGWPSFSEALPGAFKTKEQNIIVLNVEPITVMYLMTAQQRQKRDFVIMDCV